MKKNLLLSALLFSSIAFSQNGNKTLQSTFDYDKALLEAKAKNIQPADYAGYVELKHREWMKANGLLPQNPSGSNAKKIQPPHNMNGTNVDFETGNYSGWLASAGENTLSSNGPLQNIHVITPGFNDSIYINYIFNNCNNSDTSGRQGLITSSVGTEPLGGFPLQSPMGGNYVARLNRYCASMEGSIIEQNFPVTSGQNILNYAYAVIIEDGGHAFGEQPYFTAYVLDAIGDTIPGSYVYMQAGNGTTPGFYNVSNPAVTNVFAKPWTPVSIDLSAYIGQNVTMKFIAADCIYGGHSGYAYVDARLDSVAGPGVVWPGDCNYDLTADANDLLYIGWAYGATGPVRSGATTTWNAEPSVNWGIANPYGVDFKHADTDGNGIIDINDTLALSNNYGLTHPWKLANPLSTFGLRNLSMTPTPTTVGPGQQFSIDIDLGSSGNALADTLYGISFKLHTPNGYVANYTGDDCSSSYVGVNNSSMLTMVKPFIGSNYVDAAIVRNTHTNAAGSGNLLRLNFTATNFSTDGPGTFSISNIVAVTNNGSYLSVGAGNMNLNFLTTTSIKETLSSKIKLMPNPANDYLYVDGVSGNSLRYDIVNLLGETVEGAAINGKTVINVSHLNSGNYFIRIYTNDGIVVKKFVKE